MLDKETVQHVQETANIPSIIEAVKGATMECPHVAIPRDFDLKKVDVEQYMPNVQRFRNRFETKSIPNFIEYCKDFEQEGSLCFVDSDDMSAFTVVDMGTTEAPLHKEHTAKICLRKTAEYNAILGRNECKLGQKDLAEFIEEWEDNIVAIGADGEAIKTALAAKAIRDVTADTNISINSAVGDYDENSSIIQSSEMKSKGALPVYLEFTCSPYFGLDHRRFKIRIGKAGGEIAFFFRIQKLEANQEDMAEEFREKIEEGLKDTAVTTYVGFC